MAQSVVCSGNLFRMAKKGQRSFGANARPLRCPMFAYGFLPAALLFSHVGHWVFLYSASARQIKVTICARVQLSSGLNVVLVVPLVTSSLTAHSTASA